MTNKEIEKIIKKVQSEADKKNQKYFEKVKTEIKKEFSSQIGVYTENVNERFKATSEGFMGTNEKLDKIQGDIDGIRIELRDTKLKVIDISYNFNLTLDKKVDKKLFLDLDSRVNKLEKTK